MEPYQNNTNQINSSDELNYSLVQNKIEKNPENPKPTTEVKSENNSFQNYENFRGSEHASGLNKIIFKEENEKKSEKKENDNNISQTIDLTSAIEDMRKELNSIKDGLSKKLELQTQQIDVLRQELKQELGGLREDLGGSLKEIINILKKK